MNKLFVTVVASIHINKMLLLYVCFHWDPETIKKFSGDTIFFLPWFKPIVSNLVKKTCQYISCSCLHTSWKLLLFSFITCKCLPCNKDVRKAVKYQTV